jgi:hypothetical protein
VISRPEEVWRAKKKEMAKREYTTNFEGQKILIKGRVYNSKSMSSAPFA